jgi:hypothetical protein
MYKPLRSAEGLNMIDCGLLDGRDSIKVLAGLDEGNTDASLRGVPGLDIGGGVGIRSRS